MMQIEQLTQSTEASVKQLHVIGPNALEKLRRALKVKGLSFAHAKQMKG